MKMFQLPRKEKDHNWPRHIEERWHICGAEAFYKLGKVESSFE